MSEERYYQSIFETASDGLIVHDVETGRVVAANPAAGAMHGYAREEFIGLHAATFIHPDSRPPFSEYFQAVQCGGVFQPLIVHVRRDGSPFYVEWRGTAFTYQGRRCLLSVVRDVSDRVQAVVDWYGPTDLVRMAQDLEAQGCSTAGAEGPNSALTLLLGGPVSERPDLAEEASPTAYLSSDDPPLLIQHGTRDCTVPYAQSQRLQDGLAAVEGSDGVELDLFDAGHGGAPFRTEENLRRIFTFFSRHIR